MSKRARGDGSLTGGVGDVNTAILSTNLTQTANDTAITATIQTPVTIVAGRGNSIVMEILKVMFYIEAPPIPVTSNTTRINGYWSTKNFGTTEPALRSGDALVFASADVYCQVVQVSGVGEEVTWNSYPMVVDLTDGAGHGFLVATSNIFFQVCSANTSSSNTIRTKIIYRLKKVNETQLTSLLLSQNQS